MLGPRTCGTCTACCKTHPVRELEKPAGKWCKLCDRGVGCTIYESRPLGCKDFECQWLKGFGEREHRPNKVGIVVDYVEYEGAGLTYVLFEASARALKSVFALSVYRHAAEEGRSVLIVPLSGTPQLSLARGATMPEAKIVLEDGRRVKVIRPL